jgi:hypothetical protein
MDRMRLVLWMPIGHTTPTYPIDTITNKSNGNSNLEGGANQTGKHNPEYKRKWLQMKRDAATVMI